MKGTDFLIRPQAGVIPKDKFGRTASMASTVTNQDIWAVSGLYKGFDCVAAETVSFVSNNAADVGVEVTIEGLDANWDIQQETVTLNGTTPVVSTLSFIRAARGFVSGSQAAVGSITFNQSVTTANTLGVINPEYQQTNICAFTVPNGYRCVVTSATARLGRLNGAAGSVEIAFKRRDFGKVFRAFRTIVVTTSQAYYHDYQNGFSFGEKTDICARVISVSDNSSYVTAEFEYLLLQTEL